MSCDSDNTVDNEGNDFTIPGSEPGTARVMSLNHNNIPLNTSPGLN